MEKFALWNAPKKTVYVVNMRGDDPVESEDMQRAMDELKAGLKAPYVSVTCVMSSIAIRISLEPREAWRHGIYHNSRHISFMIHGGNNAVETLNCYDVPRFRKARAKTIVEAVAKINKHVAKCVALATV